MLDGREAGMAEDERADEAALLAALRRGDEAAFLALVERHHTALVRLAQVYVGDRARAEDVAQEAWLGVVRGLGRFEGRSSLKTWLFRILVNCAKTRAVREARSVPFSDLGDVDLADGGPSVEPERFHGAGHRIAGHWSDPPRAWDDLPEERLLAAETRGVLGRAIEALPPGQRAVVTLRDVEGLSAAEVCNMLGLSETNQRVLLHRARSRLRQALESYRRQE